MDIAATVAIGPQTVKPLLFIASLKRYAQIVGRANDMSAPTRLFCHIFRRVPFSLKEQMRKNLMTHEHDFIKDLDGQVTCSICGAR